MAPARFYTRYRTAAETLWGPAGAYAVDEFARLNLEHFDNELRPVPIVIGITAFGRCLGLTRAAEARPRITLASNIFDVTGHGQGPPYGSLMVADVLLHEMVHVLLMQRGEDPRHNARPWCVELERLSPAVVGCEIRAAPARSVRVDGTVLKRVPEGCVPRAVLASWPQSLRPAGFDWGAAIPVESY